MISKIKNVCRSLWNRNTGLFLLTVSFLAIIHPAAFQDRMVLILFCLASVGCAYALMRRRAMGLAACVVAVTGALMFAELYYSTKADSWNPLFDSIRDMAGLAILLFVTLSLLIRTYKLELTERQREISKYMEEQLVSMRAEALRRTSHEVRTPLSTITAISETLLSGATGELNNDQREFVGDIDETAKHLMQLVNDILDFAKAEAGMIRLAPEPVALSELVDQCVKMLEVKAQLAGVSVSAQVATEVNEITADPLRLRQILLNLLSNAVKFTPQGGAIVLRVRAYEKNQVRITVRDTGRGIAPEHLPYLFEPYYQAAVTDQGIGTGLGLGIIRHLTQLHQGTVTVDSVEGAGTVFTIDLPLHSKASSNTDSTTNKQPVAGRAFLNESSRDSLIRM